MRDVSIVGVGQTPVSEHWAQSLRHLALGAIQAALQDANIEQIDAVIVANALGANLSAQNHLGALIADVAGLPGVEALRVEAADASGGMALRQGYMMVAGGLADMVLVVGVEKATERSGSDRETALMTMLDADYEANSGATPAAMAALLDAALYGRIRRDAGPVRGLQHQRARQRRAESAGDVPQQDQAGCVCQSARSWPSRSTCSTARPKATVQRR